MSTPQFWLLKTEPETYNFSQLKQDGKTNWDGVRNYQARNFLKQMAKGDIALIYHSGKDKAVVGIAKITTVAYPDLKDCKEDEGWVQVDLTFQKAFKEPVPLSQIKATAKLKDIPLIRQSRLSVMPITKLHFNTLTQAGGLSVD